MKRFLGLATGLFLLNPRAVRNKRKTMMKTLFIPTLAGMMLWAAMTRTEAAFDRTPPSQAAEKTYSFTVIAEFKPPFLFNIPSNFANGPVITNDGTVVYSVGGGPLAASSIFSGDGTVTRLLVPFFSHAFTPLAFSVSGNGMLVMNTTSQILDVNDGTVVCQLHQR